MHCCVIYAPRSCGFCVFFDLNFLFLYLLGIAEICIRLSWRSIVTVLLMMMMMMEHMANVCMCVYLMKLMFGINVILFFFCKCKKYFFLCIHFLTHFGNEVRGMCDGFYTDTTTFDGHMYFLCISIKIPMSDIHLLLEISFFSYLIHVIYFNVFFPSYLEHTEAN